MTKLRTAKTIGGLLLMAPNKPSRWSRRTGTVIKKAVLKSKHADLKAAKLISIQAKKETPKLKEKIEADTIKWSAYDSRARAHAHREELKKLGIDTTRILARTFVPTKSKFSSPTKNEVLRSELMILIKDQDYKKRLGAKDRLRKKV